MDRLKSLYRSAALALAFSATAAHADIWNIIESEQDQFDRSKSTVIAQTKGAFGVSLSVRCLEGEISLLVDASPSSAAVGDKVPLKIVADHQPALDVDEARVVASDNTGTGVQFGDELTLEYLKGAQKISVRVNLGGASETEVFSGGYTLANAIAMALRGCGKSSLIESDESAAMAWHAPTPRIIEPEIFDERTAHCVDDLALRSPVGTGTPRYASCRALTESFLTSLRDATEPEVTKAMGAAGVKWDRGRLHFISYYGFRASDYSKMSTWTIDGWGNGDVNFSFDEAGRVYLIDTRVFGPLDATAEYFWNRESLPTGCSDLPQSKLPRC